MRPVWWPRRLAGQLAALVACALFGAQAVNFTLLLHERARFRIAQAAEPVAARIVDTLERAARADRPIGEHGRVRLVAADPTGGRQDAPPVADAVRAALADTGLRPGRIATALVPLDPDDPLARRRGRAGHGRGHPRALLIAVEAGPNRWLVQRQFWGSDETGIVWRLALQTLILYGAVLVPVLWLGRRISRPLADLAHAAEAFGTGDDAAPLSPRGPADVAATIRAFERLRARVRAMLEEKDRMLGALAHDLRTPLAALRVRIESVDDDTDRERMADTIAEMNRTLDDILSLARVGRSSEPVVEVDLPALVDAVVEDFRDLGAPVAFAGADRLTVRLRAGAMRRAVRNLIENAVKYGGATEVTLARDPRQVAIVVADRGPGIPDDAREAVFDAFTRLEGSRNRDTGGIGLGLALARAIVRDAGGEVSLANRPGGGLAATILLPLARGQ